MSRYGISYISFMKIARKQGYYYKCSGCPYVTLSSNEFMHTCSGILDQVRKMHKGYNTNTYIEPYFPMKCIVIAKPRQQMNKNKEVVS